MLKIIIPAAALAATAALAQAPNDNPSTQATGLNGDPNQIVCVNERETGSRVATRRVCRTRAEWVEHNAEQRRNLDRVQGFKPVVCADTGTTKRC